MAYFAPYIDSTGLHIPSFADILAYEQEQFLAVYGQSVYTGNDSADTQWINIFSLMINDAFNTAQLVTNGRSPATAIGGDLDTICKINGITRKAAIPSTAVLTITGVAGTVINLGVAQDINNYLWDLPISVTIPVGGSINVTATCETLGPIAAAPGTIKFISTPTSGWNAVTNASQAVVGTAVESDSQLRARQALSVSLSAKTLINSTLAGIAAVPGVTRFNPGISSPSGTSTSIENPTGSVDSFGNPAHSISMVVEGGTDLDVATAIYNNKTPGCLTNGTTSIPVTDPITGATMNIGFFRPTYVPIFVTLNIHTLSGYSSAVTAAVQNAIVAYLNSLQIGESLTISALYAAAASVMPNLSLPQFSIQELFASAGPVSGVGTYGIGATAGTGYVVGDVVTAVQGGASGGQFRITAVGGGGVPTALTCIEPGNGYTVATNLATTGGTGTGLEININQLGPNTSTDVAITQIEVVSGLLANVVVNLV